MFMKIILMHHYIDETNTRVINYPYTLLMLMNKQWSYIRLLYLILYITFNVDENDSIITLISIEIYIANF